MVTKEQFVNGLVKYIDNELMPALPTASKWCIGGLVILAQNKVENIITQFLTNPMCQSLEIVTPDGLINIDVLATALRTSAERYGKLQLTLPVGGTLTFSHFDIDKLKSYIIN